ncbi:outer membrane lipoprotein-sorting protein [Vibrio kasasachensis]|uniref:outer membrane lipoprotein-sorting protein n=1 Tax=Vibrio kasasachensis TaxID=2910248 RepID=UPI003D142DDE
MFSIKTLFTVLFVNVILLSPSFAAMQDVEVSQLIEIADKYRLGEESARVVSVVSLYKSEELDKTRQYTVYSRPNRESLVIFNSPVEAGQKMLMLQDNFWLQMPKSRRPIRITPMQKLLGDASIGDISSLTWSEDYQGKWIADEIVVDNNQLPYNAHQVELTAKTNGASYQRINLWIEQETGFPIKADLYLRSGKLAKQAYFARGVRDEKLAVIAMTLLDTIQPNNKTVVKYLSVTPWQLEDKFYNPSFLARNNTTGL